MAKTIKNNQNLAPELLTVSDGVNAIALTQSAAPDWLAIGEQLLAAFAGACAKKETTIKHYCACARYAFDWLAEQARARLDAETVKDYALHLANIGKKAATLRAYIQAAGRVIEWGRKRARSFDELNGCALNARQYAYLFDPCAFDELPKADATTGHKRGALTGAELDKVTNQYQFTDNGEQTLAARRLRRDRAICEFMAAVGCRCVEITRLRLEQIQIQGEQLAIGITHKGHIEADTIYLPLSFTAAQALLKIKAERAEIDGAGEQDFVFTSMANRKSAGAMTVRTVENIINKGLQGAGVKSQTITPHSLRHTFATQALESVSDAERPQMLREVQRLFGHTSTQITERYTHDIDAKKARAQSVVEAARLARLNAAQNDKENEANSASQLAKDGTHRGRPKGAKNKPKRRGKSRK